MAASPSFSRAARAVAAACAAAAILLALARFGYPYELEWMEGASVDHVARVLQGRSLYPAPSLEFVPLNYPPLYYFVAAGVARVDEVERDYARGAPLFALRGAFWLVTGMRTRPERIESDCHLTANLGVRSHRRRAPHPGRAQGRMDM